MLGARKAGVEVVKLREVLDTARFPVLGLPIEEDLKGLLALARERGYKESAEGFYSKCHLCRDLRKHLAMTGDYPELSPREFYLQLGSNASRQRPSPEKRAEGVIPAKAGIHLVD